MLPRTWALAQYLAKLPGFLASALWDVLVGMQFADVALRDKDRKDGAKGPEVLSSSGKVSSSPEASALRLGWLSAFAVLRLMTTASYLESRGWWMRWSREIHADGAREGRL